MVAAGYSPLRQQLLARREKIESLVAPPPDLIRLLGEVDSALQRMEEGSYGLCEACHDAIEKDRLAADPLVRFCLDHLTPAEQHAFQQDLDLASQIQAALLPRHLHAIFRTLLALELPLDQMMRRANRVFCESTLPTSFATLVCGRATESGEIEIANAGHCPPLIIPNGSDAKVAATGLPLGMFCDAEYAVKKIRLEPRQSLFLYTDGLTEARNPLGEEYGAGQLSRFLSDSRTLAPPAVAEACLQNLIAFLAGAPRTDDVTIMVIQRSAS